MSSDDDFKKEKCNKLTHELNDDKKLSIYNTCLKLVFIGRVESRKSNFKKLMSLLEELIYPFKQISEDNIKVIEYLNHMSENFEDKTIYVEEDGFNDKNVKELYTIGGDVFPEKSDQYSYCHRIYLHMNSDKSNSFKISVKDSDFKTKCTFLIKSPNK